MSTSANPTMASMPPQTQALAHSALKGAQAASVCVLPFYLVSMIRHRSFSVRQLMRTSILGTTAGAGLGAGLGFFKVKDTSAPAIDAKVQRLAHSPSQIRADDYSIIGATLAALVVPTIFLKRAPFISLVLGGAGIGLGAGTAFHVAKEYSEGQDARPTGMVGDVPVVGGNAKS